MHNGDTVVTTTGTYRLRDNKWVKIAGNLRVRSHDHLPSNEAINVERIEHKFICDALPDTSSDPCTEKIYIPIHGDHMDDVRPKGKPLTVSIGLKAELSEIMRKQIDREAWASILRTRGDGDS